MTQWGLDNLFNPGKRHMDDEKRRLQSTREEIGDNSGGRRIDLEGGKVSISVPRRAAAPADAPADDAADLDPALEAEDVPAVALASDETEIEPELAEPETDVVTEPDVVSEPEPGRAEVPEVERTTEAEPAAAAEPEPTPEPVASPEPGPVPAATTPKRRQLSANAWARRG